MQKIRLSSLCVYVCENEKYWWIYYIFFEVTYVWKHAGREFQEKCCTVNTVRCRLWCPVQNCSVVAHWCPSDTIKNNSQKDKVLQSAEELKITLLIFESGKQKTNYN